MNSISPPVERIAVLGLGYVGCVSAACLSSLGHRVIGVDVDRYKVESVNGSRTPFFEPGLEEMLASNVAAGRLSATTSLEEAIEQSDIALVCVGTPSRETGDLDLAALRRVADGIGIALQGRKTPFIVAIRSTVFPGTCEAEIVPRLPTDGSVEVVSNPEFLREGTAVKDFMEPPLLVVGGPEAPAQRVAGLCARLPVSPVLVSLRTAEMIKYACNAFHAAKIGFANEIGTLAAKLGVSPDEVMGTLCLDRHLNISPAYLKPGFAFGGSCLPKDLRALEFRARSLGLDLALLTSILPSNNEHLRRSQQRIYDLGGQQIGIFGLAFKEMTDDLRESPTVALIEYLIGKGRKVRVFDPQIKLDEIHGSNKGFLLSSLPHIRDLLVEDLESVLGWADHLVVTQRSRAYEERLKSHEGSMVDLTTMEAR